MTRKALITGVFGQTGSYLAEILYARHYEVHGLARFPLSSHATQIANHLNAKGITIQLHEGNLTEIKDVEGLLEKIQPAEIYHLAATHFSSEATPQERVRISGEMYRNNILSGSNLIFAIRDLDPSIRLVLAGSCLMYDALAGGVQDEKQPFHSNSVYGLCKIAVAELARQYRNQQGLHVSNAILYNHESPRRPATFVTQKIAQKVAQIKKGMIDSFVLGNLNTCKDWGYAKDYALGLWLMTQQKSGDDYILATGETHSVKEFLTLAFEAAEIDNWEKHVTCDEKLTMSAEGLKGNSEKAFEKLGWKPGPSFRELVRLMVNAALVSDLD